MLVRKPAVAGQFYPSNPEKLRSIVISLLDAAKSNPDPNVNGIVVPHAGYIFSGKVAAEAYSTVRENRYDAVILLAPSHFEKISSTSIFCSGEYSTPLGNVRLAQSLAESLVNENISIVNSDEGHLQTGMRKEHALEVQLPFLQVIFGDSLRIVPIIIGQQELSFATELADQIAEKCCDEKILLVASSDLSHFYSEARAHELDTEFINAVKSFNTQEVQKVIQQNKAEACGFGPVMTAMHAAKSLGAMRTNILKYATSADAGSQNRENVVGYMAASFTK
ncbi:AmmeMemoRadiSam system protein B [bacterium]|nr:AmmeMemoRadiSam system protein B [bacterium]